MDHISTMFNGAEDKTPHDTYPICGICGEPHEAPDCDIVSLKATISDTPVLSKARQSLPAALRLVAMADGTHSVLTLEAIAKGTRFGPYEAKEQFSIPPSVVMPLKVFKDGDDADDNYFKEYYLNTTNEYECNWMCFVGRAHSQREQNLICFQDAGRIYFISVKDIGAKEHLRVWYAPYYGKMMKMGALLESGEEPTVPPQVNADELNALMKKQQNIRDRKTWICKFCGKHEENIATFALHISEHYSAKLRKNCEFCDAKFQTTKALNKHIYIQHNESFDGAKLPPDVDGKQPPDARRDGQPADPLLNDVPGDNVLLEHLNFQDAASLPNETLQLNVDTILNEDENFNFELAKEIDREPERFVCDICLKEFGKLKLLIVHLNAHTGRFTCAQCMRVFVRKENFVAHKCIGGAPSGENKCAVCDKLFTLNKYLKRHMDRAHGPSLRCARDCKTTFGSKEALDAHSCAERLAQLAEAPRGEFTCHLCAKVFGKQRNLSRHLKTHDKGGAATVAHICEVCSKQFTNMKALRQHLATHKEPEFVCMVCEKSFQRKQNFLEHMEMHKSESPQTCNICNAKFTQKKFLTQHLLVHTDEQTFACAECPQRFRQKSNLTKHVNDNHSRECAKCAISFGTPDECRAHVSAAHTDRYECPVCNIRVKLRSSLKRHVKQKHTPDQYDAERFEEYVNEIDKKFKEAAIATSGSSNSASSLSLPPEGDDAPGDTKKKKVKPSPKKKKKIELVSNILVTMGGEASTSGALQAHAQSEKMAVAAPGSQEEAEMLNLLQANNAEVMQDMASGLQLDEIVNVLGGGGGKAPGHVSALDYGSMAMEFETNFASKAGEIGMTHTFDGDSVCLSMPELNEHGQPISIGGENIQSSFILENASLNGPVEQVVLYILDQKPS